MVGTRVVGIVGGLTRPLYRAWVRLRLWAVVRGVDVWDRLVRWYWRRQADRRHFWRDFIKRSEVRDHFMGV